LVNHVL